ncbi:MAG TPA: DNA repair protein RadA [Phycisphaerae bacterium]|nr:DNA repair protein RadA [Phycisphaerae bacterium]
MAKSKTYFLCRNCGSMHPKWLGKCPDCQAWDSLEEVTKATEDPHRPKALTTPRLSSMAPPAGEGAARTYPDVEGAPTSIADVPPLEVPRISTHISELDRVLGGGVVPGSAILLGGEPGIGKSTLLLQALAHMATASNTAPKAQGLQSLGSEVLYVTSEESAQQTQLRAQRLGFGKSALKVLPETNLEKITGYIGRLRPALAVIDSVQMIYNPANPSAPGSVSQLRDCCTELVYLAKAAGTAVCLVGHVTKEGLLAGPKLVEHIVDTVLYFEGDTHHDHRIVRAAKNRFGTTLEIGLFRMTGAGLEPIDDASTLLLEPHDEGTKTAGSVITAALQGSRVLMVEVQALTTDAMLGTAKRKVSGADSSRVAMIIAVLEKRAGLRLVDKDVFVNVVGGIKLSDPSADAAIALAIASAHMNRPMMPSALVLGELGLLGEFRTVNQIQQRITESQRLGFAHAIIPARTKLPPKGTMRAHLIKRIDQAIELLG